MPTYADADALRLELDLDPAALTDAAANRLLEAAEDLVDRVLGPGGTYPTGRRLDPTILEAWRAAKLERATVTLAKTAKADPTAFDPPRADAIKGPAFELTGIKGIAPAGETALRAAVAMLDQAGLRNLTARARA